MVVAAETLRSFLLVVNISSKMRARRSRTFDAKVVEIVRRARAAIDIEEASREGVKGATGIVERTRDGTENDT